ncbi:MAG: CHAT domain-containing protein [Burkholderiales bacterium]|nr:CHAT domain-containing protein [Burkholderiales bacterium]
MASALQRVRHCIVAGALLAGWAVALGQGSAVRSLRDAQAWQEWHGKAEEALRAGDFAAAAEAARRALGAGDAGFAPGDPNLAASQSVLGAALLRAGNAAAAEQAFRAALAIYEQRFGGEHEFVGAMLNNLGLAVERQGNFAGAELLLRRALAIKQKLQGEAHPDTAVTLANLARVLDRQGRSGQLAARAGGGDAPGPARRPAGTGAAAVPEGGAVAAPAPGVAAGSRDAQAESLHRSALAVHERELGSEHPTTLATLTNLGNVMLLAGRYAEAEAVFRRVLAAREKVQGADHPDTALALNNVANALFEQSRQEEGGAPAALDMTPARRARVGAMPARPMPEAEALYRRALAIQERAADDAGPALAATLNNLAVLIAGRGRFDEAEPLHRRALEIAERVLGPAHLDTASMQTTLAITYDRQGRLAEAERLYARAVATAREAKVWRNLLVNASSMGYSLARRGRLREALPYYREAVDALDALYAESRGLAEESRQAFLGQFAYVYRELIRILATLGAQGDGAGLDREALAVASRGQSRVFSEMLRQADVARFSGDPRFQALRDERDAVVGTLAGARYALLSVTRSQADAAARRAQLTAETAAAEAALARVEDRLWREFPRYMELANPRPVTVDDLQQRLLRPGEALVTFALLGNETVIFAVTRERFRMAVSKVSREEIARRVALVRRPMERIGQGDPPLVLRQVDPANLAALYRDLLQPVADVLAGARGVLVVADGALYALPLELLVTRYGEAERTRFAAARSAGDGSAERPFLAEYATLPYAGAAHRFTYLPSLAALASQRLSPKPAPRHGRELVAFADPVFAAEDGGAQMGPATRALLGALAQDAPGGGARIPRLPETAQEAREVAALVGEPAAVFLRREAQEARVKSGVLRDARYVLFATHGFLGADFLQGVDVAGDGEARSGRGRAGVLAQPALALTLTGDLGGEDGLLSMREVIEDLELGAELVVLSACNTAGEAQAAGNGEGFAGLTRAFMYAGARRLLVSHWAVESEATLGLVTGAFRELKSGSAAIDALPAAQAKLAATRFSAGGRHYARAHPFFWSPFVLVGD